MSYYYGIRCDVIIKPEYRQTISELDEQAYDWSTCAYDFMRNFSQFHRSQSIPNGPLMEPFAWEEDPWPNGRSDCYDPATGHWKFQCSINSGLDEIEYFFDEILAIIVEELFHLEVVNEGDSVGILHRLVDNKIEADSENKIYYSGR